MATPQKQTTSLVKQKELNDNPYLGYAELALGLIDCFLVDYALLTWFLGFGVLHIVFGIIFMLKNERKK